MSGFVEIEEATVKSDDFLKLIKRFKEFRIKFKTENSGAFKYFYPLISKKDLRWFVRTNKAEVKYQIRYNSKVGKELGTKYNDIVYVMEMRSTLSDI